MFKITKTKKAEQTQQIGQLHKEYLYSNKQNIFAFSRYCIDFILNKLH